MELTTRQYMALELLKALVKPSMTYNEQTKAIDMAIGLTHDLLVSIEIYEKRLGISTQKVDRALGGEVDA